MRAKRCKGTMMIRKGEEKALIAWANESERPGGCTAYGQLFDGAMGAAQSIRERRAYADVLGGKVLLVEPFRVVTYGEVTYIQEYQGDNVYSDMSKREGVTTLAALEELEATLEKEIEDVRLALHQVQRDLECVRALRKRGEANVF